MQGEKTTYTNSLLQKSRIAKHPFGNKIPKAPFEYGGIPDPTDLSERGATLLRSNLPEYLRHVLEELLSLARSEALHHLEPTPHEA